MTESTADVQTSTHSAIGQQRPVGLVGWILYGWLVVAYSESALTLLNGSHLRDDEWIVMVLGTGAAVAYFRKRRGQRGWPGFFVGSALGYVGCFAMAAACGLIRGLLHRA